MTRMTRMTNEEAKIWLNKLYTRTDITDEYGDMEDMQPYEEAVDMATKALEQEHCEDAISRDKAIVQLSHNKIGDDDCDVIVQKDIETIKALPSVTPQQRTGHWIDLDEKSAVCSCCYRNNTLYGDFCKWCGTKMVEPQKSEVND